MDGFVKWSAVGNGVKLTLYCARDQSTLRYIAPGHEHTIVLDPGQLRELGEAARLGVGLRKGASDAGNR